MFRVDIQGTSYYAKDLATLQKWVDEGRLLANNQVWVDNAVNPIRAADVVGLQFSEWNRTARPPVQQTANYYRPSYQHVPNHLALAILSTLCCCMPFGVVSIVYAAQVDGHVNKGDVVAAMDSSEKAKNWAVASIVSGFVIGVLYFALLMSSGGRLR